MMVRIMLPSANRLVEEVLVLQITLVVTTSLLVNKQDLCLQLAKIMSLLVVRLVKI